MMVTNEQVIEQTKKWIEQVVIGCNFCPFAARVMKQDAVFYIVETGTTLEACLHSFVLELERLDADERIETSLLIFSHAFQTFEAYLQLLSLAEQVLKKQGYEGIYQVASFHPKYLFAGSTETDAANFTNRSIYPMLHLLREDSVEKALEHYKDPDGIPERNIQFAREKGLAYMKALRNLI
jgi:uncharacterized protein